jgi:type I restriction enzyme S subunit
MKLVACSIADALDFYNGKAVNLDVTGEIEVFGSNGKIGFSKEFNHENAIILGRVGAFCGSVMLSTEKFWATDNTIVLKTKGAQSLRYWFYRLGHFPIRSYAGGAAQPLMTHGILRGINIKVHADTVVQEKIANILSTYDSLIENNRRRMALLEDSARLLYREWFVRLRFPGYEHTLIVDGVPQGWERTTLGESITLNYGKALKAEIRIEGDYPVYGSSGIVGTHEKPLVQGPAIVLGRKGNVGSVYWSSKSFYPIDTVYFVSPGSSSLYLFYALKSMHFISTDVAVPGLNRDFAYSRPLLHPPVTMLRSFHETVEPIHAQLDKLEETNQKLRAARDLLLPRLMSGELAV